jgi:Tol biopolymer transport system component
MPLAIGTQLGPYEVVAPLGAGGMGEVYRARDTKLGREVAIKVLPAAFASDPDRRSRLEREARLLGSLNHPHIATVHGVEDTAGVYALVMELVEGPTLEERLGRPSGRSALPIPEALTIARQIADALEAAHEKGIVHRDLKPANIKLTREGMVKVLDFGLATVMEPPDPDVSSSPTMNPTRIGTVVGTAAYMSPEQARGLAVDKRTDIWAFGCVLFEMVAGRQAFTGATASDVMVHVLEREPDWTALTADTPSAVRRLLTRCLQKDPRNRLRDIGDSRIELETSDDAARIANGSPPAARRAERVAWGAALAAASGLAVMLAITGGPPQTAAGPEMRVEITTPPTLDPVSLAISPDGRQLVFVATSEGRARLWIRPLDSSAARPLARTDFAMYPFWSADGRSIGFFADGRLKRLDLDDGSVRHLAFAGAPAGGAWNRDGTILFAPTPGGPLMRMPAAEGPSTPVTRLESPQQAGHLVPHFLPDGRRFLFYVRGTPEVRGVYVGQLDSLDARRLMDADSAAVFASTGHLLFVRGDTLFAHAFDPDRLTLTGRPFAVAEHVMVDGRQLPALVAAASGLVGYRVGMGQIRRQFAWFDRSGQELGSVGVPDDGNPLGPALSPDGERVALHRSLGGAGDIWMLNVPRAVISRFTVSDANDIFPVWSPDGGRVVFSSNRMGTYDLYVVPAAGGTEAGLIAGPGPKIPTDWSANGHLLFNHSGPTGLDVRAVQVDGARTSFPVAASSFDERDAQFSPDGKWIAFQSNESGQVEVYVQPFPGAGGKSQISANGGAQVRWRADGQELFYVALDGRLTSVPVGIASNGQTLKALAPVPLFVTHLGGALQFAQRAQYMVSRDGRRFLINRLLEEPVAPITLLLNWQRGEK